MKLVFVTGSLVHGGAERQQITLFNRLAERGHECHFVYVKDDPSQLGRLRPGGEGTIHCLRARRYLDFGAIGDFAARLQRLRPAVIIAANAYPLLYATAALRYASMRVPLTVTFHTTVVRGLKEWLQMLYYRPFFWNADCAVFVCETQRRFWKRRGLWGRRTEMIYNGVDLEQWQAPGEEERRTLRGVLGFGADDFVAGLCAVLRPEKNPVQLVEAIAALRLRGLPARALLIGDGPLRGAVEARARALGVAEAVTVTGLVDDVRPMVAACDAMVLCSRSTETFSLAALEAMALGKPALLSETGGAAEMIRPGREGFLFPVGDTRALISRLALLADRALGRRMGGRARETVEAQFSERTMVDRYEKLLTELEIAGARHESLRRPAGAH